jgi:hypothetical protein
MISSSPFLRPLDQTSSSSSSRIHRILPVCGHF